MNIKKKQIIEEIKKYSNNSIFASIIEYKGTKSIDLKYLRQEFHKNNIIIKVVKNKLATIALKNTINEKLINNLNEQTLLIFSNEENNIGLPIKIINKYIKANNGNFKLKKICVYGKLVDNKDINHIINIPDKNTAIYNLIKTINKPITNFATLLKLPQLNLINLLKLKK